MLKECNKCNRVLGIDQFYSHPKSADGKMGKCKDCSKRLSRENREQKRDYYLAYDRMRANSPERIEARREYQNTERGKITSTKGKTDWIQRNPAKRKAHCAVSNAIRDGKLERRPCIECGNEKAQAHHEDYTKPFEITWLCVACHSTHHVEERSLRKIDKDTIIRGSKHLH